MTDPNFPASSGVDEKPPVAQRPACMDETPNQSNSMKAAGGKLYRNDVGIARARIAKSTAALTEAAAKVERFPFIYIGGNTESILDAIKDGENESNGWYFLNLLDFMYGEINGAREVRRLDPSSEFICPKPEAWPSIEELLEAIREHGEALIALSKAERNAIALAKLPGISQEVAG